MRFASERASTLDVVALGASVGRSSSPEDVEKMHQAWVKSVILQVTLWSHPYVKEGDF